MGWFIKFIDSSVGKKLIMAVTGLFLYFYLIIHLAANLLLLLSDPVPFNTYADIMSSGANIPIRIIEVVLFLTFIYHIINGIRLWFINKKARGTSYDVNSPSANSTFFSRFMVHSGIIVFIFLVIHLRTFFIRFKFNPPEDETMYQAAMNAFSNTFYSLFYIVAMILLAFHLVHGFQSAFQTLGLRHNKYTSFIKGFGIVFSILLCIGFAIIPLYILLNSSGGN